LLSLTGWAQGIEFSFSTNDVGIESCYDVDDQVYVFEEASADAESSTIEDYRKASGDGFIHADQYYYSPNYWGMACAYAPGGGAISGSASLKPTILHAGQTASLYGPWASAFMEGGQSYRGSYASTLQIAETSGFPLLPGWIRTSQSLTLGDSIYSSQNTHAVGLNSYAVGTAGAVQRNEGLGAFKGQGALIGVASLGDPAGSIDAKLYAEVVRRPENIDPLVAGKIRADSSSIAFGGALAGDVETDLAYGEAEASGAAALTGVYGGELDASLGAQTDRSQSAWIVGESYGLAALQAAAAGNVNANLAKQKATAEGAFIGSGAILGGTGGSMSASTRNSASVSGSDVYATGLAGGIGTGAGYLEAKWKNDLKIGVEGSAVGAGVVAGVVGADKMSAKVNDWSTKAKISGLWAQGALVGAGAIAYYKPLNGKFSGAAAYSGLEMGSIRDGQLVAKSRWTNHGLVLKAKAKFDADSDDGIAIAETTGPGHDDYDEADVIGSDMQVKAVAKKIVNGKGKAKVEVA